MHAFLIVGNDRDEIKKKIETLSKKLEARIYPYQLSKIEDVRTLNKFIRLSLSEKTLITVNDIDLATTETLNAFLKNLEEPQENLYFALSAANSQKVIPTIVSRCQVVKIKNKKVVIENEDEIRKFLSMNTSQKLAFFDKIRDRNEAKKFVESLIHYLHTEGEFTNMDILLKTLTRLNANGNVNLQLSNLAINFNGK